MSRRTELIALLLADTLAFAAATVLYYVARFEWQWFDEPESWPATIVAPVVVFTAFWLCLFFFFGMYRERYADSRFDELVSLAKVVTVGVLVLVFAIFIESLRPSAGRSTVFFFWIAVFSFVAAGRIIVRSIQKSLILRGQGLHRALIVGWSDRVEQVYEEIGSYPEAGLQIVGAIRMRHECEPAQAVVAGSQASYPSGNGADALPRDSEDRELHSIESLPRLIDELNVQDVLIAIGSEEHGPLMEVLRLCDGKSVSLKLIPDFYTIIGGMARTEHMYGLPLIEVLPEPMPAWEKSTKRLIDIAVSSIVLVIGLPAWIAIAALIRITSQGPAIYRQQRVGQQGKSFTMYKFRTMGQNAEADSGPVWAQENDPRYTPIGRWLRTTRLDEIPQFWNVLKGDMSLVGPRPERPFFVEKLSEEIPLYSRRHRLKPGITGWAQVKWKYDTSLEDVRQKVKYDLFYIENVNLRMDFKILFRTIRTTLLGKGQ